MEREGSASALDGAYGTRVTVDHVAKSDARRNFAKDAKILGLS